MVEHVVRLRRGKSPVMWAFVMWLVALFHTRRCCALCLLKNVNHYEVINCNHITNGQLPKTSVHSRFLCFVAMWKLAFRKTVTHEQLKVRYFFFYWFSAQFSVKCILKPLLFFVGTSLGPSVLFTHFLEHLFLPIMGRSEETSIGLPTLGNQ